MRTHKAMAIAVATLGMMLAGASSAFAGTRLRVEGASMLVSPGGYLYCTVKATSRRPITLTVSLLDQSSDTTLTTEFGSSYVASPLAYGDGLYHAEATAGAFSSKEFAGSCRGLIEVCACDAQSVCDCQPS